jgi:hypothetical protein
MPDMRYMSDMRGISDIYLMSGWGDMSDMSLIYDKL